MVFSNLGNDHSEAKVPRPEPSDALTVRPAPSGDGGSPRIMLLKDGKATGCTLEGAILEAAYRWGDRWLVFLSDDVPFEDSLGIVLLDSAFRTLDVARLGAAYATGHFVALPPTAENAVAFRFFGDTDWAVQLLNKPGWRLFSLGDPPGVRRPSVFARRYFRVIGQPQPASG